MNETPEGFKQYYLFDHPVTDPNEFNKASVYNNALNVSLQNIPDAEGKTFYMYTAAKSPRFAGVVNVTKQTKGNCEFTFTPCKQKDSKLTPYTNEQPIEESAEDNKKRTKEDIIKEHLKINAMAYNGILYIPEYMEQIKKLYGYPIFDFFYPSVKIFSFAARKSTSIGGLWSKQSSYNPKQNWYKVKIADDNHNKFAKDVGSLMSKIFYTKDEITPEDLDIATEWLDEIEYHHAILMEQEPYSKQYFYECQYLHDLFWDPFDDPRDSGVIAQNIVALVRCIVPEVITPMNEHDGLITKQALTSYLADEISDPDFFLLPDTKEYPIIDKSSLKLAMDSIRYVTDDDKKEFIRNLNKKMQEYNYPYKITIDHPYAKYAPKEIIIPVMNFNEEYQTNRSTAFQENEPESKTPYVHRVEYNGYDPNLMDLKKLPSDEEQDSVTEPAISESARNSGDYAVSELRSLSTSLSMLLYNEDDDDLSYYTRNAWKSMYDSTMKYLKDKNVNAAYDKCRRLFYDSNLRYPSTVTDAKNVLDIIEDVIDSIEG